MTRFNEKFQDIILPVIIVFVLLDIVGFLGNLTVIYVYSLRYPRTNFRYLVLALGLVDLTSCCTTVPMETVSSWFWFNAPSRILCKAKNFCVQLTALSAMYMLFVTAVYKYRQVCKPFERQIARKALFIMYSIGILCSVAFASPAAFLWDINNHTVAIGNDSEIVFICEVHCDFGGTIYPTIYRHLLSAYNLYLLTTIVLYVFVARTTILHVRKRLKRSSKSPLGKKNTALPTISQIVVSRPENQDSLEDSFQSETSASVGEPKILNKPSSRSQKTKMPKAKSQLSATQIRKIIIMVILAGMFSVTFVLGLSFGYVFAIRDNGDYASLGQLVLFFSFYRIYFINYAMNPVVYLTLDRRFRAEALKMLWGCRT